MARSKSDDKRNAILAAATRMINNQGLSASTALIAHEAGVANGTFFTYFKTKIELLNELYLELKTGMVSATLAEMPSEAEIHEQFYHIWSNWMYWAVTNPEKRRTLTLLSVSDEITSETRIKSHQVMAHLAKLVEQIYTKGPMSDTEMAFVTALMNSLAEATMDFMVQHPEKAEEYCKVGFNALWRMIG
jgi:AcrR family transcriptional regulator